MTATPAAADVVVAPSRPPRFRTAPLAIFEPRRFHDDKLGYLEAAAKVGPVVELQFGPVRLYLLREPADVARVLVQNAKNYGKDTIGFDALRIFLGNGLLTSEGEFWRRQRRIAQPAFHHRRIEGFAETMVDLADEEIGRIEEGRRSGPVDLAHHMTSLTQRVAGTTLLGADPDADVDTVGRCVEVLNRYVDHILMSPIRLPLWIPTPKNRRARWAGRTLDGIVAQMVKRRRAEKVAGDDLLSMLLEARDEETGEGMTDAQLRDEVVTIFLAGHETTANALAWTFYLLSTHSEHQEAARAEVDRVLAGRRPTAADVRNLGTVERIVKESMRLYPPAWFIERSVHEDDVVGGYRLRRGALVGLVPWVTHRLPHLWDDPERFDPDRFLPEREKARPRFAYFPFGGGQRLCIGKAFAMMESVLVVSRMLQRYEIELADGARIEPEPLVTLRPKHGVPVVLRPRSGT